MKRWIYTIRYGWDAARVVRLVLGLMVITWAVISTDKMMMFMGGWLVLLPLLNVSCCGAGGCDINHVPKEQKSESKAVEIASFEELKSKP